MALAFSVITDEISQDLGACLAFAADEGLDRVDVRSVERANFLSLDAARQRRIARQIRDAGLAVGCLATPLLKWPAPGRTAASAGDQFGFDAKGRPETEIFAAAFEAGQILGTRHLRVFSYLTCDGFQLADLEAPFAALLRLAESHDMVLHVENEPVCNVRTLGDLDALMRSWRHPRLKALLDIGNAASAGAPATVAGVASLAPHVDQAHFKDYS
jgi:sugar phosphate isomerase/epimerase